MAKQKRRKDGLLQKCFRYNGKRFVVYGRSAEELRKKENEKRAELEKGLLVLSDPTFKMYSEYYIKSKENAVKETTLSKDNGLSKRICETEIVPGVKFGDLKIKKITKDNILKLRMALLENGTTPQYINMLVNYINSVFKFAVSNDLITKNVVSDIKKLKRENKTVNETVHRSLTQEEINKFFQVAKERNSTYYYHYLFLIKTGMRCGELGGLMITDIDKKNGYIHINRTVTRDINARYIIGKDTKTSKSKRAIPLTPELEQIITKQLEINKMLYGLQIDDLRIFRASQGGVLTPNKLLLDILPICKAADIERFSPHCFRNTFATMFISQRPGDYKILSELLGHSTVSITLDIYTHTLEDKKIESMNAIQIKTS